MITAAPPGGPRWYLADWLELEALCSPSGTAPVHSINADAIVDADVQAEEMDDEGLRNDDRIARVTTEVQRRSEHMGAAYPFRMSDSGEQLEYVRGEAVGPTVYLFCLLASHARADGFLRGADVVDMTDVPNLLQACATWCAAGYEDGPAYALGLDPHSAAFLPRLGEIYRALRDGTPRTSIPPGGPTHVKDDGIDVVAWKATPHLKAPASYLLAQVASGQNWKGKTVKAAIERFHNTWFVPQPACAPKAAMAIPFCIEGGVDDDEDAEQEALAMQWRRLISEFGELFYRYTLPPYAAEGVELHGRGVNVDMVDWLPRLRDFVRNVIGNLQAKCR